MLTNARENIKVLPSIYEVIERDFGGNIDAYVDNIYDNVISRYIPKRKRGLFNKFC